MKRKRWQRASKAEMAAYEAYIEAEKNFEEDINHFVQVECQKLRAKVSNINDEYALMTILD